MPEENKAQTLLSIERLIHGNSSRLETLTKESQEQKSMLNSILENNDEFQQLEEETKKQSKLRSIAKQKALTNPAASKAVEEIRDLQLQIKELKTALSDYLSQFIVLSGANEIEGPDGVLRKIVYTAKLVKSKN
jgi:chromosome segregation ATPase